MGTEFLKKGQLAEPVARFQQALEIEPDHVGALNMLGMVLGRQQKFAEAGALENLKRVKAALGEQ